MKLNEWMNRAINAMPANSGISEIEIEVDGELNVVHAEVKAAALR